MCAYLENKNWKEQIEQKEKRGHYFWWFLTSVIFAEVSSMENISGEIHE